MNSIDQAVLLSRLAWPSAMVQERAASQIARLLLKDETQAAITHSLSTWLDQQTIESTAISGILAICKATRLGNFNEILAADIAHLVKHPSLLSNLLLRDLDASSAEVPLSSLHSGDFPSSFVPCQFFSKYVTMFLPMIYDDRSRSIEQRTGLRFRLQWEYEWTQLLEKDGITPSVANAYRFYGRPDDWHHRAVSFPLSEYFRSSYLRALAWALSKGALSRAAADSLVAMVCPVNLDTWAVAPHRRPSWWPMAQTQSGDAIDTSIEAIWHKVRQMWNEQQSTHSNSVVLAASGIASEGPMVYDLTLAGVFQRAAGPSKWDVEEAFGMCQQASGVVSTQPLRFSGVIRPSSDMQVSLQSNDWLCTPATIAIRPPFGLWQPWRIERGIRLPAPWLSSTEIEFACENHEITASIDGDQVAWWYDWTDGLTEMCYANLPSETGFILEADRQFVDEICVATQTRFAWIASVTCYWRPSSYGEIQTHSDFQDFGTTYLVVP